MRKIYIAQRANGIVWVGIVPWRDKDQGYEFEILHGSSKIQNLVWYQGDYEQLHAMIKRQIRDTVKQSEALSKLTMQVDRWFELRQKHMTLVENTGHVQYVINKVARNLETKPFPAEHLKPRLDRVKNSDPGRVKK